MATVVSAPRSFALFDRVQAALEAWKEARARRAIYNRTLRELNALSERELSDVGISRLNIEAVALRAAQLR